MSIKTSRESAAAWITRNAASIFKVVQVVALLWIAFELHTANTILDAFPTAEPVDYSSHLEIIGEKLDLIDSTLAATAR